MGVAHTAAFVLSLLAVVGIIFTTAHNEWKKNSFQDSQLNLNNIYQCAGLWVRCTSGVVGQIQCDSYETAIIALPAYLTALRAMMIISCILSSLSFVLAGASLDCNANMKHTQRMWIRRAGGVMLGIAAALQAQRAFMVIAGLFSVVGLVAGALGLDCIHAIEGNGKIHASRAGGICIIFAGILTLAAASWYAAEVIRDFWQDQALQTSFQYEFGAALYIGWISSVRLNIVLLISHAGLLTLAAVSWYAAGVVQRFYTETATQASFAYQFGPAIFIGWVTSGLALIAGALMACCSCSEEYEEDYPRYNYNPSKAHTVGSRNTEYV